MLLFYSFLSTIFIPLPLYLEFSALSRYSELQFVALFDRYSLLRLQLADIPADEAQAKVIADDAGRDAPCIPLLCLPGREIAADHGGQAHIDARVDDIIQRRVGEL